MFRSPNRFIYQPPELHAPLPRKDFTKTTSSEKKASRKEEKLAMNSDLQRGGHFESSSSPSSSATSSSPSNTSSVSPIAPSKFQNKAVKSKNIPSEAIGVTFNDRYYSNNDWSALLRPGPMFALLKCLSAYFIFDHAIVILQLKGHEVAELRKLMAGNPRTRYTIHSDEIGYCKRIVLAHVNPGSLTEDIFRRLDVYAEVTTCFEEIESGAYDIL